VAETSFAEQDNESTTTTTTITTTTDEYADDNSNDDDDDDVADEAGNSAKPENDHDEDRSDGDEKPTAQASPKRSMMSTLRSWRRRSSDRSGGETGAVVDSNSSDRSGGETGAVVDSNIAEGAATAEKSDSENENDSKAVDVVIVNVSPTLNETDSDAAIVVPAHVDDTPVVVESETVVAEPGPVHNDVPDAAAAATTAQVVADAHPDITTAHALAIDDDDKGTALTSNSDNSDSHDKFKGFDEPADGTMELQSSVASVLTTPTEQ
jgi:hypothetical protein